LARSALDASGETALPRLLAMLCILAVFTPAFFMTGAARALFLPLSLAVGFSMVASYLLSSTFVPILTVWVMKVRTDGSGHGAPAGFTTFQERYGRALHKIVQRRRVVIVVYLIIAVLVIAVVGTRLGVEIFPKVDAGQFQLRLRAPSGTRIER